VWPRIQNIGVQAVTANRAASSLPSPPARLTPFVLHGIAQNVEELLFRAARSCALLLQAGAKLHNPFIRLCDMKANRQLLFTRATQGPGLFQWEYLHNCDDDLIDLLAAIANRQRSG
jgi:hypothetical protein